MLNVKIKKNEKLKIENNNSNSFTHNSLLTNVNWSKTNWLNCDMTLYQCYSKTVKTNEYVMLL